MKRILAILMACLFMVAVMAVMAVPAFAGPDCTGPPDDRPPPCKNDATGQTPDKETGNALFVGKGKKK